MIQRVQSGGAYVFKYKERNLFSVRVVVSGKDERLEASLCFGILASQVWGGTQDTAPGRPLGCQSCWPHCEHRGSTEFFRGPQEMIGPVWLISDFHLFPLSHPFSWGGTLRSFPGCVHVCVHIASSCTGRISFVLIDTREKVGPGVACGGLGSSLGLLLAM